MTNPTNVSASPVSLALVTGGSRGLGKSMALHLAERGVDVIITYHRRADEAQQVVEAIRAQGRKAVALAFDAGDTESFGAFAESVRKALADTWKRHHFD